MPSNNPIVVIALSDPIFDKRRLLFRDCAAPLMSIHQLSSELRDLPADLGMLIVVQGGPQEIAASDLTRIFHECREKSIFCIVITQPGATIINHCLDCLIKVHGNFDQVAPMLSTQLARMIEEKELVCIDISDFLAAFSDVKEADMNYLEAGSIESLLQSIDSLPLTTNSRLLLSRLITKDAPQISDLVTVSARLESHTIEDQCNLIALCQVTELSEDLGLLVITTSSDNSSH